MGATCWSYFTPYEPDANAAFTRLQAEVFARGDFYVRRERGRFESIEEVREVQAEEGTHSILDMIRVVGEPFSPTMSREQELARLLADADAVPQTGGEVREGWETGYGTVVRMNDDV